MRRDRAARSSNEGDAIAAATGLKRAGDMTFGEFTRARLGHEIGCSAWKPHDVAFSASKEKRDGDDGWMVYVEYEAVLPFECERHQVGFRRALAIVDPKTSAVRPPPDFVYGSQRTDWLRDFLAGDAPDATPRAKPALSYEPPKEPVRVTMKLGERIRIPFGPVRATGGAITFTGIMYGGPGIGPADYAMIRGSQLPREPRVEAGTPMPHPEETGIEYQQMLPGEDWFVFVTGTPEVRRTIHLTEVTFQWSPGGSLDPTTTSFPIDVTIVVG